MLGRYTYAIGGNEEATALSGVNVSAYKIDGLRVSGLMSAVTALLLAARLDSAQPIAGINYELDAIAAVVIGGASLMGGSGTVVGTLIGALIMSVLRNGLNLLGVSSYLQQIAIGAVISRRRARRHGASAPRTTPEEDSRMRSIWQGISRELLALSAITGCNRGKASDAPTVALVVKTLNNPFFIEMEKGARAAADSLKIPLVVQAPEREIDVEKQMQIVENLIQDQVKVLRARAERVARDRSRRSQGECSENSCRGGRHARRLGDAASQAGGQVATFIGSDNVDGGRIAGEFLARSSAERGTLRCSKEFRGTRPVIRGWAAAR